MVKFEGIPQLASVDLLSSFRLISKYSEAINYATGKTSSLSIGISQVDKHFTHYFCDLVAKNVKVKLAKPNIKAFSNVGSATLPMSEVPLAKSALRIIISSLNLDDIWAEGTGIKLNAFSNFAYALIRSILPLKISAEIAALLVNIDPLSNLSEIGIQNSEVPKSKPPLIPHVDIDFIKVQPENIYARKFLSYGAKFKDLETALNKTEQAEKTHQEMLKDVAEFLLSKGITPFESDSIDLMFQSNDVLKICEIKSANFDNFLAQASKGAFQLTCYIEELIKSFENAMPYLILRRIGDEELESYLERILLKMNIPVLYYNPNKSWPDKIKGLI